MERNLTTIKTKSFKSIGKLNLWHKNACTNVNIYILSVDTISLTIDYFVYGNVAEFAPQ